MDRHGPICAEATRFRFHVAGARGGVASMIFAWKVLGSRPGSFPGVLKWRSDDRFASCLDLNQVRA
jgi:hypothetical protein